MEIVVLNMQSANSWPNFPEPAVDWHLIIFVKYTSSATIRH